MSTEARTPRDGLELLAKSMEHLFHPLVEFCNADGRVDGEIVSVTPEDGYLKATYEDGDLGTFELRFTPKEDSLAPSPH